jgi:hypothetical protein
MLVVERFAVIQVEIPFSLLEILIVLGEIDVE